MAKRGGDNALVALGVTALLGFMAVAYLKTGRGQSNSPLVPDRLEDPIDKVVATLNNIFGRRWVTAGLNALQTQLHVALPGMSSLVDAVYWVEQNYGHLAGAAKKQHAKHIAMGRR